MRIPPLVEGQDAKLECTAPRLCLEITPKIYWIGIKDVLSLGGVPSRMILTFTPSADYHNANITCVANYDSIRAETTVTLTVKCKHPALFVVLHMINMVLVSIWACQVSPNDHNCSVYPSLLSVAPRILNSSQCMVDSRLLVCVCISWGNPLPLITWPLALLTDFSVTSSRNNQTVNSTLVMPAADYQNSSVRCISDNELGWADFEIPLQHYRGDLSLKCE